VIYCGFSVLTSNGSHSQEEGRGTALWITSSTGLWPRADVCISLGRSE